MNKHQYNDIHNAKGYKYKLRKESKEEKDYRHIHSWYEKKKEKLGILDKYETWKVWKTPNIDLNTVFKTDSE